MADLDRLLRPDLSHAAAEAARPPDFNSIVQRGMQRSRTHAVLVAAGAAALVAVIGVGSWIVASPDDTDPSPAPSPTPSLSPSSPTTEASEPDRSPTSMTPEEVVNDPGAVVYTTAVSPVDPDVRLAIWSALCKECPKQQVTGRRPTLSAIALTTDAYETTTYVTNEIPLGVDLHVSSPRDDLFLVSEMSNGGEWLVDLDGAVRPVTRIDQEIAPDDPRLWFHCYAGDWRFYWCSLDPDSATAYVWPESWSGSAVRPGVGESPWGAHPDPDSRSAGIEDLVAWWDDESGRQTQTLADFYPHGDFIAGSPPGEFAYWAWQEGSDTVDLHTSRDGGATWQIETRTTPGFNAWTQIIRSPDGALIAYSIFPQLVVWRAEASEGSFQQVFEAPSAHETSGSGLWTQDGLLYANATGVAAVSDDYGRSWTAIENWR